MRELEAWLGISIVQGFDWNAVEEKARRAVEIGRGMVDDENAFLSVGLTGNWS